MAVDTLRVFRAVLLLGFVSLSLTDGCPTGCRCTGRGVTRVLCPPGQTSLPAGLDPGTTSLVLSGRPLPQGANHVPVLRHPDLASLPALEELTLTFAGLEDLQEDALSSLKNLRRLSLHDNRVRTVTPRTFSGLDKLDFLDLTNNEGCVLQGDVFGQLTSMKTLYLGGMGLRKVKAQWFKSLSALESLDLNSNQIEILEPDFLQGLSSVKMLDLTGNQLQWLHSALEPIFTSLPVLYLGDNPWHCNCLLRWFKQLRRLRNHSTDGVVCQTPQPLAFREVVKVPDGQLTCLPPRILRCGGRYDVNAGSDVIMECDVEGDPFPEVTWSAPGGGVADISPPGRFITSRKTVNSSAVTVADFSVHHGQWNVSVTTSQGSASAQLTVNVLTTTTTTTTTTIPSTMKTTRQELKTTGQLTSTSDTNAAISGTIWFYLALAAFGLTALALVSLIMVAAFKIRKNQRQVGQDRRNSEVSLSSAQNTNLSVISNRSTNLRSPTFC